jgi:hypothetical protein
MGHGTLVLDWVPEVCPKRITHRKKLESLLLLLLLALDICSDVLQ